MRHLVLSAVLWLTYLTYWRVVLARGVGQEALISFGVLVFFIAGVWTGTRAWVDYNRRLARKLEGRRAERPPDRVAVAVDFHRRRIRVQSGADLRHATRVIIHVEGDEKHFRAESLEAEPPAAEVRAP